MCTRNFKGIVQWIFLYVYVVVLISGYTLLFIGTKSDQYFLRYLQKHAQILAVLKKQFIQEITVTWKATCRKDYLSPSDITIHQNRKRSLGLISDPSFTFPVFWVSKHRVWRHWGMQQVEAFWESCKISTKCFLELLRTFADILENIVSFLFR